jgi:hypothetical protein
MQQIMPRMNQVATLVGGDLSVAEKQQLVGLLQRLHLFHNPLFLNEHDTPVEKLLGHVKKFEI